MLRPERARFLDLLGSLDNDGWTRSTECPEYDVKGIATHVLGDDLSLLSRQRDEGTNGLLLMAESMPGADFRGLLDAFNDQWVTSTRFFSVEILVNLLRTTGEWTAEFYETVDLQAPCEPVFFFGSAGEVSPYWQAIAREFVERWVHHSQIRRALGLGSLADEQFVRTGVAVVAAAANVEPHHDDGQWSIGDLVTGDAQQTADLLTRAHTAEEIPHLVQGPDASVELAVAAFAR
jgi:uncharacterized protein (TIGR03083 family)